ncbi:4-hydroxyphenylacetate isomerase [Virgibacillus profundi]|uniref:4-hydroxyphenylacetate isomerase n=1 Tax=Virgibacillus profundi TaxID=2024555 RepID=A0A2A2IC46_9BACI|nr:fumarylacetoacetate hydrolase family protein [Virgibacillus profundi]PAV28886.1 4-hydroxyphenylacetate isomerase [Virgibacillus profundi]PXY53054.1 4-hydroxyphenylacetate isomerase [Virgibacillus profundi]
MISVKLKLKGMQQFMRGTVDFKEGIVGINGDQITVDKLPFDIPLSGTVYGTILNYKGAYETLKTSMHKEPYKEPPKAPILYIKPANTLISSDAVIPLPEDISELEMGAALGVVIGTQATKIAEDEAFDYVFGYTVVNDVSIPHESVYRPAVKEKARDGFCPAGPWIIEREAVKNPDELNIYVYINGQLKQENNTSNLIRPIGKLLADVTAFMTLYEGDTLLVGIPENAPLASVNDHVQIEIEGVGKLQNTIKSEKNLLGGL